MSKAISIIGKTLGRRRAVIGLGHVLFEFADKFFARNPSLLVSSADWITAVIESIERLLDFRIIQRQRTRRRAAQRDIRHLHTPRENPRYDWAQAYRCG